MSVIASGVEIDGFSFVAGRWQNAVTGEPLSPADMVQIRTHGGWVLAVNPVTQESTSWPQWFIVTDIDGVTVRLSPSHAHLPVGPCQICIGLGEAGIE